MSFKGCCWIEDRKRELIHNKPFISIKKCNFCNIFCIFLYIISISLKAQTTLLINSPSDTGAGSLREAITIMNSSNESEPFKLKMLVLGPISLRTPLPELTKSCEIEGLTTLNPASNMGGTTIERHSAASTLFRIFKATTSGKTIKIRDLILQNGVGAEGPNYRGGGAILTDGVTLTMQRCLILNGETASNRDGGGVQIVSGPATLEDCLFESNNASDNGSGGGLRTGDASTINSNLITLNRCTFISNTAFSGSAIFIKGDLVATNCTFENNTSWNIGSAIKNTAGITTLIHCTFRQNGGSIAVQNVSNTTTEIINCLFKANKMGNFGSSGIYMSLGGNVSDAPDKTVLHQATDKISQDFVLAAAAINSGLVPTCAITGCAHPAANVGVNSPSVLLPATDACNLTRRAVADAGAYEDQTTQHLGKFTSATPSVCTGSKEVVYAVPLLEGDYYWTYSGAGASINGSGNGVSINFDSTATSGTLEVAHSGGCNQSLFVAVRARPSIKINNHPSTIPSTGSILLTSSTNLTNSHALVLDGVSQYVTLQNAHDFAFNRGDFTIETWMKVSDNNRRTIVTFGNTGAGLGFMFFVKDGKLQVETPTVLGPTSNTLIAPDTWYHVAVVKTNTVVKYYLNGEFDGGGTFDVNIIANGVAHIGYDGLNFANAYFKGQLDELKIWNIARTQAQIVDNKDTQLTAINYVRLIGVYHFDNNLSDAAGEDNGGLSENNPTFTTLDLSMRASYLWPPTNSTTDTLRVYNKGVYKVLATNTANGCTSEASTTIIGPVNRYVNASATSSGDGQSWATAYQTLQEALDVVKGNDSIFVAQGTYLPTASDNDYPLSLRPIYPRSKTFRLPSGVSVFGGFANTGSPTFEQRNPSAYPTILSGNIGDPNDSTDNAYHVVLIKDNTQNTHLEGFIITEGNATTQSGNEPNTLIGAGIYDDNNLATFTLSNCMVKKNTANDAAGLYGSNVKIINCVFTQNNSIKDSSIIYINRGEALITNATIANNKGIGVLNHEANITVSNTIFWNNTKGNITASDRSTTEVRYSIIDNNHPGIGNINANPQFVSAADLSLICGSPAINAGSNALVYSGLNKDLTNRQRIVADTVDMGAYESVVCGPKKRLCLDIKVFLEGPLDGSRSRMITTLNQQGLLPGQTPSSPFAVATPAGQPYSKAPWRYQGTESQLNYAEDVVDWILVSLRTDPEKASSSIYKSAALLRSNGLVAFIDVCPIIDSTKSYYIAIEHRNHIGAVSHQAVPVVNGKISYDFTTQNSYTSLTKPGFGQNKIAENVFALMGADMVKTSFQEINASDNSDWSNQNGRFARYLATDANLDGQVNASDNTIWSRNNGKFSSLYF
jgi:Concanavalin A-like lectin/glucanases superfamily